MLKTLYAGFCAGVIGGLAYVLPHSLWTVALIGFLVGLAVAAAGDVQRKADR